jgi:hypothetical protein
MMLHNIFLRIFIIIIIIIIIFFFFVILNPHEHMWSHKFQG